MIIGFNPSADCNMYCRFKIQGVYSTINAYTSFNDKIHAGGVDEQIYGNQHQNYGYISIMSVVLMEHMKGVCSNDI